MDLSKGWVNYLRRQEDSTRSVIGCPLCKTEFPQLDAEGFTAHVRENQQKHAELETDAQIRDFYNRLINNNNEKNKNSNTTRPPEEQQQGSRPSRKRPIAGNQDPRHDVGDTGPNDAAAAADAPGHGTSARSNKKLCSPPPSEDQQRASSPSTSTPARSRARPTNDDFNRGTSAKNQNARLWQPGDQPLPKAPPPQARSAQQQTLSSHLRQQNPPNNKLNRHHYHQHSHDPPETNFENPSTLAMIREPETRPISQDQLINEVKGIYAGLVMVEGKCIEVDNAQSSNKDADHQLSNDQWQALIALHRTLLHEHHDFFLASQHPSASPALKRLASKYAMPARMWRHGIHSFLELLRHKLPASLEHMLSFIYLSYSIMALLYETVPTFEETWIECLGDLGRYRMAIEDDDIRDREVWTGVSRYWYSKASEKSPTTGRLYHHLAILARPNALQQLYYYNKSLCVPIPFASARESIMTLFDPVLNGNTSRLQSIDAAFVRVHGILISGKCQDQLESSMEEFLGLLDGHIGRTTKRWLESGYFIGIALGCLLLEYGSESNVLMKAIAQRPEETDVAMGNSTTAEGSGPGDTFKTAVAFTKNTYEIVVRRWGDVNALPFLHTVLVFMAHMAQHHGAMAHLEKDFPWKQTSIMLNVLSKSSENLSQVDSTDFPRPPKNEPPRPLPEDYAMRGLIYSEDYFPSDWFNDDKIDEDEKYFELASMVEDRRERILWLGRKIARSGDWLVWKPDELKFDVHPKYDIDIESVEENAGSAIPLHTLDEPTSPPFNESSYVSGKVFGQDGEATISAGSPSQTDA